jgi:hypothetical protein
MARHSIIHFILYAHDPIDLKAYTKLNPLMKSSYCVIICYYKRILHIPTPKSPCSSSKVKLVV